MREIKYRSWNDETKLFVYFLNGVYFYYHNGEKCEVAGMSFDWNNAEQYTGYKMQDAEVYFGDLVSNNYRTDKEVVREIVLYEGNMMMKRIKGKSSLPKYIELHGHHALNYQIIGNIHDPT